MAQLSGAVWNPKTGVKTRDPELAKKFNATVPFNPTPITTQEQEKLRRQEQQASVSAKIPELQRIKQEAITKGQLLPGEILKPELTQQIQQQEQQTQQRQQEALSMIPEFFGLQGDGTTKEEKGTGLGTAAALAAGTGLLASGIGAPAGLAVGGAALAGKIAIGAGAIAQWKVKDAKQEQAAAIKTSMSSINRQINAVNQGSDPVEAVMAFEQNLKDLRYAERELEKLRQKDLLSFIDSDAETQLALVRKFRQDYETVYKYKLQQAILTPNPNAAPLSETITQT